MKNPFETLIIPGGILLLGFLSALLLPAPSFGLIWVFCLWFLLLGTLEFFVIRFIWRRWFQMR